MIKKSIKNRFCTKAITALLAFSLMSTPVALAEITLEPVVTVEDVTLTVKCGTENAKKAVIVQIFEPEGSLDNLKDASGEYIVTDADKINEALCCVYHGVTDDNGDMTFTFAPTGDKGKYVARVFVEGVYSETNYDIEFICNDDAAAILAELALAPTKDAVAALFVKSENENVYKPYQILELDKNAMYAVYDEADDTVKEEIHKYIAAGVADNDDITPEEFTALYEDAVLVEILNVTEKEAITDYIDAYADALDVSDKKAYTSIYGDSERFDESVKDMFAETIADADLSGMAVADVADLISDELLLALLSNTSSQGIMDAVIGEFEDELEDAGADMDEYNDTSKPLNVCRTLIGKQPFETLEDFAEELNDAIPTEKKTSSKPSAPSGGGSGVSYSTGGSSTVTPEVVIPTEKDDIKEETKPATEFSDIANVAWAHEAIAALKEKGIISGRPDGTFAPNDNVTREEFVKMLVLVLGMDVNGENKADFADISGNEWFAPYVYAAYNNGIVTGTGDAFGAGNNISRQDMVVMCARGLEKKGIELKAVRDGMTFADSISDYAAEAVEKLWSAGIVNGLSETEFGASNTTTRAQAAKLLYEVLKAIG